jgi:hypothetical protein
MARHVARVREVDYLYKISVGEPGRETPLGRPGSTINNNNNNNNNNNVVMGFIVELSDYQFLKEASALWGPSVGQSFNQPISQ